MALFVRVWIMMIMTTLSVITSSCFSKTSLPKITWEQAASPPLVDPLVATTNGRSTVFARWRLSCLSNIRDLGLIPLTTYHLKRQLDRFSRFCRTVPMRRPNAVQPHFPQSLPIFGKLDPYVIRSSLGTLDLPLQTTSRSSQPFFHNTRSLLPTKGDIDRQIGHRRNILWSRILLRPVVMGNCGVLPSGGKSFSVQQLACHAISASAELVVFK